MSRLTRRAILATTALAPLASLPDANGRTYLGGRLPFEPGTADPPIQVVPGPWQFFTAEEGRTVEAIVERLIPADELSVSGKDAGCALFIDRQLAGQYGRAERLYMRPPFLHGMPSQGDQSALGPAARYRTGLAALDALCRKDGGKPFADRDAADRDRILEQMEAGHAGLDGPVGAAELFNLMLQNTMEGFFGDPVYGGNRGMVSWRMIGFPGVRYDFRDHVAKHNQRYPLPPVSIMGRPEWKAVR